ncbi:MAG: ATP-binding cassette domain-containing protein [Bacillus sp. (in: firmicutes)]
MSIIGPNRAGTTMLLKRIMGLLRWTRGETTLEGLIIVKIPYKEVWKSISYVPQVSKIPFA